MGKHEGSYARVDKDRYETPRWPVVAACEYIDIRGKRLWEPFCGSGQMSDSLSELGAEQVYSTDIEDCGYRLFTGEYDFLSDAPPPIAMSQIDGIFSNPPFGERGALAAKIIRRGLQLISGSSRFMVLLLPIDYDAASTRSDLFQNNAAYLGKVVLQKRIKWFDRPVTCKVCGGAQQVAGETCGACGGKGVRNMGPKENHAFFVWQAQLLSVARPPAIMYAPKSSGATGVAAA